MSGENRFLSRELIMNSKALYAFLSESTVRLHLDYLRTQRLKLSIIEKSHPQIKGKSGREILRMKLKRDLRSEIISLYSDICAHQLYFSSFAENPAPSEIVRRRYGSENSFVYEMKKAAQAIGTGFVFVLKGRRGTPEIKTLSRASEELLTEEPLLVLDLCEHAYFPDYGFALDKYLNAALSHIDLSRL